MIFEGDAVEVLRTLEPCSVDACVTSPPYWRMRDYGHERQIGLEPDVADYVEKLAEVFDEVARVLVPTGTAWVNLGDAYARRGGGRNTETNCGRRYIGTPGRRSPGLKPGDLAGVPWRFAFALQDRGWYLRSEVIWHKPNPAPDSCTTRPAIAHEHLFMFSRVASPGYYYDGDAIRLLEHREPHRVRARRKRAIRLGANGLPLGPNRGSVWTIAVASNRDKVQHFAMGPEELARLCVLASCPPGGVVLDPFVGAGTTALAARKAGRSFLGIELVHATAELARDRLHADAPLLGSA